MVVITPITLTEWRLRCRNRCDLVDSVFVGDGYELATMINDSANVAYDFLIECLGDETFMNSCVTTVAHDSNNYNTGTWIGTLATENNYPISPWKLVGVKFLYSNFWHPCRRINVNQNITDNITARSWVPNGVFYTYHWEYIQFYPNPASSQTVRIEVIPALKNLHDPSDTFQSATVSTPLNQHPLEKFSDLIVLDIAIKCCNKQERLDVAQAYQLELNALKDNIKKNAPKLDRTPRTIVDAQRTKDWGNRAYRKWGI
jgi:ubiquitin-protein ligase